MMLHVATVHWRTARWIDPQLRYLARYLPAPFRVYAFLNGVRGDQAGKFFYSSTEPIEDHETKLDVLADVIRCNASAADDVMVFVDGDAFPVAPVAPLLAERLERHRLIAVKQFENNGDVQPHPCFCVTTVGLWHDLGATWQRGHAWLDLRGKPVTDVGGNLLKALEEAQVDWYPLVRVNRRDLHPVLYGLYGDDVHGAVVYHHGGAFRHGLMRIDSLRPELIAAYNRRGSRLARRLPKRGVAGAVRERLDPERRLRRRLVREVARDGDRILARIERDEEFWSELL